MTGESLHLRRSAIAGLILVLHGLVFLALSLSRRGEPRDAAEPAPITVTWIETLMTGAVTKGDPVVAAQPPKMLVPNLSGAVTSLPALSPTPAEPSIAVLRDYVACGMNGKDRLWTEDRERCRSLQNHAIEVAEHKPTEEEELLERKFKHAKAKEDAPLTVPCSIRGRFVIYPCLINGIINGFESDE